MSTATSAAKSASKENAKKPKANANEQPPAAPKAPITQPAVEKTDVDATQPKKTSHECFTCKGNKKRVEYSATQWRICMSSVANGRCVTCIANAKNARRFKIDADSIAKKIAEQKGKCAMPFCKHKIDATSVQFDTNAYTKDINGALCRECFTTVRLLSGRVDSALAVAAYLSKKTDTVPTSMIKHINDDLGVLKQWSANVKVIEKKVAPTKNGDDSDAKSKDEKSCSTTSSDSTDALQKKP